MPVYFGLSGDPFIVNTASNGLESDPDIATLAGGGFIAVWETVEQDGSQNGIMAQRFATDGSPQGAEFQVNTLTQSNQSNPHVTALADGGFVIVHDSFGLDGSIHGVAAQRYSAAGAPVGDEFVVNQITSSAQELPVIAALSGGNLVVIWESFGADGNLDGVRGRILPPSGEPTADEFAVNSFTTGNQSAPDLVALSGGGFVVVWQSTGQDGSADGVFGQIFNDGGTPVGDEFAVNSSTFSAQDRAAVSALADGGFAVAWESSHLPGIGSSGVFLRLFNADGSARSAEIQVGPVSGTFAFAPDVLGLSDGTVLVSWRSTGSHSVRHFDADGVELGARLITDMDSASTPAPSRLAELDNGDVIAIWNSVRNDEDGAHIQAQRLILAGEITGDDTDNALSGAHLGDRIEGLGGNDTLRGLEGSDTLIGGDGDDFLFGGSSEDDPRDLLFGGNGNDSLDGGYGNDELRGDAGHDTITGGFGVDTVIGGSGDDVLTGQAWSDLIFGGAGDDFVNGGFGHDRVNGGEGADRFFHIGIFDHGSDWIQDYDASQGDVLQFGAAATVDQFQVNLTETANAGQAGVEEAFVIYRPSGQILWALVDGGGQDSITLRLGGELHDLLA